MKYIITSVLAPGVETFTKALEVFGKVGTAEGTEALYAGTNGKTYFVIIETDEPDMANIATYAPFFESTTVTPVVPVDDAWMAAMTTAVGNVTG